MGTGVSPSQRIVTQVAASEGVPPADLEPPLYDVVDPTALDQLVDSDRPGSRAADVSIEFTYRGHAVAVDETGAVDVTARANRSDATEESTEGSRGD